MKNHLIFLPKKQLLKTMAGDGLRAVSLKVVKIATSFALTRKAWLDQLFIKTAQDGMHLFSF
jgi:hypothetical protein